MITRSVESLRIGDRSNIARIIKEEIEKVGFRAKVTHNKRTIVRAYDQNSIEPVLEYQIGTYALLGPNPEKYMGTALVDALVSNIAESIGLEGLDPKNNLKFNTVYRKGILFFKN